jgi:O-antigen/teichoic acid export membrane protein
VAGIGAGPLPEGDAPAASGALPPRLLANINFVFLSTLVANTVGFLALVLVARALGPEGKGVTALYQAAVGIGFALFNLGIGPAGFYFVSRSELSGRQAMEAGLTVSVAAALLTAVGVGATALFFDDRFAGYDVPYALAIVAIPAAIQLRVTDALLRAEGRFGAVNAVVMTIPLTALGCLGVVELTVGLTVSTTIWAWTATYMAPLVLAYWLIGRSHWPRMLAPLSQIRRSVVFGGQTQLASIVELINHRVDVFMILLFVNTAGVGLYTVSTSQTEGLWIIANSVAIVLLTNITAGSAANAAQLTPTVCRTTLLVTAVAALGAAAIAWIWIPIVFGDAYRGSVLPYLLLLPGTVAIGGSKILAAYVFSRGRPMINTWIGAAVLAVTIPTNVVLIGPFGVAGAAISTSLGYCLDLALTAVAYRRLSGGSIREALLPQRADAAIYLEAWRAVRARIRPQRRLSP